MTVYVPSASSHATFTMPDNGDTENAATLEPVFEALADEAAFVQAGGYSSAENWFTGGALHHASARLAYSDCDQVWAALAIAGNDKLETSADWGRTWVDQLALLGASQVLVDLAFDADGNLLIITQSTGVYHLARTSFATWTGALGAAELTGAPLGGACAADDANGMIHAVYRIAPAGLKLDSWNGTAWTARTLPAAWSGYSGGNDPEVGCNALGKSVAIFCDPTAPSVEVIHSSDGATWTGATATPATVTGADFAAGVGVTRPVYSAGAWYFILSAHSSSAADVFKSTDDGATWTVVGSIPGTAGLVFTSAAILGGRLVALDPKGRVLSSLDGSAWRMVDALPGTVSTDVRLAGADGGALALNPVDKTSSYSKRAGAAVGRAVG